MVRVGPLPTRNQMTFGGRAQPRRQIRKISIFGHYRQPSSRRVSPNGMIVRDRQANFEHLLRPRKLDCEKPPKSPRQILVKK